MRLRCANEEGPGDGGWADSEASDCSDIQLYTIYPRSQPEAAFDVHNKVVSENANDCAQRVMHHVRHRRHGQCSYSTTVLYWY